MAAKQQNIPNVPAKKPEVIPAQPKKDYNNWYLTTFNMFANNQNNVDLVAIWKIGRVVKVQGEDVIEYGSEQQSFTYKNVDTDEFKLANPELEPMLNQITTSMAAICNRNGGFNANAV